MSVSLTPSVQVLYPLVRVIGADVLEIVILDWVIVIVFSMFVIVKTFPLAGGELIVKFPDVPTMLPPPEKYAVLMLSIMWFPIDKYPPANSALHVIVSRGVVMDKAVALEMLLNPVMLPVPVSPANKNPLTVPVPMPVKLETPVMLLEFRVRLPLLMLTDPPFAGFMLMLHDAARFRL